MTDVEVVGVTSQLEVFLQKRCPGGESLKVTGYEPITGGYSRAMARVWVEDSDGRRGYIVRADPPPGQAIIDTDRTDEWRLLNALSEAGTIPLPKPLWFDQQAILPQAWQAQEESEDAVGAQVPAPAPQGLSCAGYGSVVMVTAAMGMAAANEAVRMVVGV